MANQSQDEFTPKPISMQAVPMALDRAERYRLLNDPVNAESICRDILAIDPDNSEAEQMLILSLTEQFNQGMTSRLRETRALADAIRDDYQRLYLHGLICERQAGAQKRRSSPGWGHIAYDLLREAMSLYERATEVRPNGDDSALLRWNTCARMINAHANIAPAPDDDSAAQAMLE